MQAMLDPGIVFKGLALRQYGAVDYTSRQNTNQRSTPHTQSQRRHGEPFPVEM